MKELISYLEDTKDSLEQIIEFIKSKFTPDFISHINDVDENGRTLLHHVANCYFREESTEVVKLLLQQGADAQIEPNEDSILWNAINNQRHEMAKLLLDAKANPNTCDSHGGSLLETAAGDKNFKGMQLLLDAKASPDLGLKGHNPLKHAVKNNNEDGVALLLDAKANPNIFKENTALDLAFEYKLDAIAMLLIKSKADVARYGYQNATPLMMSAFRGNPNLIQVILTTNPSLDVDYHDRTRYTDPNFPAVTALDYALIGSNRAVDSENYKFSATIAILLRHGANINKPQFFYDVIKHYQINSETLYYCLFKLHNHLIDNPKLNPELLTTVTEKSIQLEVANSQHKEPLIECIDEATNKKLTTEVLGIIADFDIPLTRNTTLSFNLAGIHGFFNKTTVENHTQVQNLTPREEAKLQKKCSANCSVS